jgi:hypothetical protein
MNKVEIRKVGILSLLLVVFSLSNLFSQAKLDGEFRPRVLFDNGYKSLKDKGYPGLLYVSQRSRVNLHYNTDKLETFLSVQDVRFWGDDDLYTSSSVLGNSKGLNLHQAWVKLKAGESLCFKIGRQQFVFADQRVLSTRNWNDYQVTYDALLLSYSNKASTIELALSWNSNGGSDLNYSCKKLKTVDFMKYEYRKDNLSLGAIALLTGNTLADTISDIALLGTFGANMTFKNEQHDFRLTAYYQSNMNEVAGKTMAYCVSTLYKRNVSAMKGSLAIGADWLSGHDDANLSANYVKSKHTFNTLYGNSHGLLGYMDFYTPIPSQGLIDLMLKAEFKPTDVLTIQADFHRFFIPSNFYSKVSNTLVPTKDLGSEFDFTVQWKIMKEATLQAGYSFYLTTPLFEEWKGKAGKAIEFPQFAYLMLTVKPNFF